MISTPFFSGLGPFPFDGNAKAFDSIGFADPVRKAIAAARSVPVPEHAAVIHLRGGDILHGTHLFHGTYLHKSPSICEIDGAIRTLRNDGRPVWLIGQEPDIQAAMIARHPGTYAFGLSHPTPLALTSVGAVLFDAVFMSRMTHIYGGSSGVTDLARRIGGAGFTNISRSLSTDLEDAFLQEEPFASVSAAARAHVFSKVVVAAPPEGWNLRHLEIIRTARRLRPANAFLQLVEVCVIARVVGAAEGERAARDLLTVPPLEPAIPPDMGFAFLMGGTEYFPLSIVAHLDPEAGPATALFHAAGKALTDRGHRPHALAALSEAEAILAPDVILPALRDRLRSCVSGKVADHQIRGSLLAGLCQRLGSPRRNRPLSRLLQQPPASFIA